MHSRYFILIVLLVSMHLPLSQVAASPDCRPRPEVCVHPRFRKFWQDNGALHQFGYSITDLYARTVNNKTFYVQEFERARLEFFPQIAAPHNIVIGRVGAEWLDHRISELTPLTSTDSQFMPQNGTCEIVAPHTPAVCGPFLTYHQTHGAEFDGVAAISNHERLRLFGVPLTPAMRWYNGNETIVVQLFERARFEYNAQDNTVEMGAIQAENTLYGVPKPIGPSPVVNYLSDTGAALLSADTLNVFRINMPFVGFWQSQSNGIKFVSTSFRYHTSFYSIPAPPNKKWVSFTVLVKNERASGETAAYIDYSYITVLDLEGNRHTFAPEVVHLDKPIPPGNIAPGSQMIGQMLALIPEDTGVAQIEFQIANRDEYLSRFFHVLELRVEPVTY